MKNPDVTIISSLPPIKGISDYTVGLTAEVSKKITVEILGFNKIYPEFLYPGGTVDPGKKRFESPNTTQKNVLNWYNPIGWVVEAFKIKSSIVHAQWWSYVLFPVYLTILGICKLRKKKIILTVHNVEPHEKSLIASMANRIVVFFADWYIVHSEQSKQKFIDHFPHKRHKVSRIHHGVNHVPDKYTRTSARKELGLTDKDKAILFFGNIRPYKGLDDLIKAFSIAQDEVKNAKLIIAGKVWGSWSEYQKLIDENLMHQDVHLDLDFIPESEIAKYFEASDVVVLPYKYFDSQSGVATLSLAFNKPLIVTNVGGLPDLTTQEAVCNPRDISGLAQTLKRSFTEDNFLNLLTETAKEKKKEYSWKTIADETIDLYKKLSK